MAGDEKHARELIDAAEMHQEVKREKDCDEPDCGCADSGCGWCGAEWPCLTRRLADALEAAQPGDDDWEYEVRYSDRVASAVNCRHVRAAVGPFALSNALFFASNVKNPEIMRRRPASAPGRWEPVEEVPQ